MICRFLGNQEDLGSKTKENYKLRLKQIPVRCIMGAEPKVPEKANDLIYQALEFSD